MHLTEIDIYLCLYEDFDFKRTYLWSIQWWQSYGPPECVKDAGKARTRRVLISWIVLSLLIFNNVGRTLLLGLPRKKMLAPLNVLFFQRLYQYQLWTLALMQAYVWSISMAKLAGPLMGIKDTDKVWNRRAAKLGIVLSSLKTDNCKQTRV